MDEKFDDEEKLEEHDQELLSSNLDDVSQTDSVQSIPASIPVPLTVNQAGITIKIQNLVCSINLGVALDLKQIAMKARNAEYNPKRFAAATLRLRDPKSTGLVFRTGKLICAGAKSESDARLACRKYTRLIQKIGFPSAECASFTMINLVATLNVRFPIRIESLAAEYSDECTYEPEIFPACVYRLTQPKCVVLMFVSGKCVITGAKSEAHVHQAIDHVWPMIQLFKKQPVQQQQLPAPVDEDFDEE